MNMGDPQLTFPTEFRLQKLHLRFAKPRGSDTDVKITMTGDNGRKLESEQRSKVEKGTTLDSVECGIGGMPWTRNVGNFRIDDSTTIQIRVRKAGSAIIGFRDTRESSVIRWSHIKSVGRTGDELVYETEESNLKATLRLQFQASLAETTFDSIEGDIKQAILSQGDHEEITSKFKAIDNALNPILEVMEKVSQINAVATVVVGLVKMAHDRLIDRQIKYDEVVRSLLQDMTDIHPFAKVASANQSDDIGLVHQTVAEMLNLIHDACMVIAVPSHSRQGVAHLKVLTAVSREDLVREFKRKLDVVIRNFHIALDTEVHAKVMTAEQKAEATEIKEWLTSLDVINRFISVISTHVPGTGSWFLEREDILAWMGGKSNPNRLFCIGIPGCGKTMMISLVCKTLLQKYQKCRNTAVLCVYFDHKDPKTHSFDDILLSFTRQLIQQGQPTPEWIRHYYHDHSNFKDINELQIQLSVQLNSSYSAVFILADAMDECPPTTQRKLLEFLKSLSVNTHSFLTSRPGHVAIPEGSSFWMTIDLQTNSEDVLKYVERRLVESDDPDMLKNHEDLRISIKEKVLSNANGVMLLAKLHMDAITEQNTPAGVSHVLENLPNGLDATVEETIQRIKKQKPSDAKLAMKILLWIVGAKRPLSVRELKCAVALELTDPLFDERAQPAGSTITRVCAGLVIIDADGAGEQYSVIRLVHLTVQEYFTRVKESFFDNMEVQLASLCLKYLLSASHQGVIYGGSGVPWYNEDVPVFLQYCGAEWPCHSSGCQLQVLDLVLEVLQNDIAVKHSFNAINSYKGRHVDIDGTALHLLAYHGLQKILNFILLTGKSDPSGVTAMAAMTLVKTVADPNSKGRTVLSYAAEYGHVDMVNSLLERGEVDADVKDEGGSTPLSYAAENGHVHVVNALLEKSNAVVDVKDEKGVTPLFYAAVMGHVNVVNALLEKGNATVDFKDEEGGTALVFAAVKGQVDVVNALLEKGKVEVDARDKKERTPLSYAAEYGHVNVMNALLETGNVLADVKDEQGRTPLSYAAEYAHVKVVNALLERGDVLADVKDEKGVTPLFYAAMMGHANVVNALLEKGNAAVDFKDERGRTPLFYAILKGHVNVVNVLLEKGSAAVDVKDEKGRTPLSYAAKYGPVNMVNAILERDKVEVDVKDKDGQTPLLHAATSGRVYVVNALLERDDVDADVKDERGRTPVLYAAAYGHVDVVNALLEKGELDTDVKDEDGRTPLLYAATYGHVDVVNALLERGEVDADVKDEDRRTPFFYAARFGHVDVVNALLERGEVDTDVKDKGGKTPLLYSAENGHVHVVNALLEKSNALVDAKDERGRTPLSYAAACGHVNVVNVLLEKGSAAVDVKDEKGRTPLSYAAQCGEVDVVNALLETSKGAVDAKDEEGRTPLIYASKYGGFDVLNALLEIDKVVVDAKDEGGRTPLLYAAAYGHVDVVNTLLERGELDADVKDEYG